MCILCRKCCTMNLIKLHGKHSKGCSAKIDDEDFEKLNRYRWQVTPNGYIYTKITIGFKKRKSVSLSRLVMGEPEGLEVDHIDRDKFNNQKANLRLCTRSENVKNTRARGASRFKGVSKVDGE